MRRNTEDTRALRCCLAVALLGLLAAGEGLANPFATEDVELTVQAAEDGSGEAQAWLGDRYAYGLGVTQDLSEAAKWYHRAAEIRSMDFENIEIHGDGPPNAREVLRSVFDTHWGRRHLLMLSGMYRDGVGTPQDYVAAYRWLYVFSRAGGWGSTIPQPDGEATTLTQEFRGLAEHMTDDQIAEAKRSAREFLKSYVWSWSAGNAA